MTYKIALDSYFTLQYVVSVAMFVWFFALLLGFCPEAFRTTETTKA